MTPLGQGYPLYDVECQIPDALGYTTFESVHTQVCAPKTVLSAKTCLPSLLQKSDNKAIYESYPKGVQTCHVRETIRFLPHMGCSHVFQRCQFPNAVWDGACQMVVI